MELIATLVPLLQDLLWVGLVAWVVIRFRGFFEEIASLVNQRVKAGSSFKAGLFELGSTVQPQDVKTQIEEVRLEAIEYLKTNTSYSCNENDQSEVVATIFNAQNLVFREIQEKYGVAITQNVKLDGGLTADGLFIKDGKTYLVEIKLIGPSTDDLVSNKQIEYLIKKFKNYQEESFTVILCFVETGISKKAGERVVVKGGVNYPVKFEIWSYSVDYLKAKFGIS